jgi:hypothetical protein
MFSAIFMSLTALAIVPLLFLNPRVLLSVTTILLVVQLNWFVRFTSAPNIVGQIGLLLGCLLGGRVLIYLMFTKKLRKGPLANFVLLIILLIILTVFSALVNEENIILGLFELRFYYLSIFLAFGIYIYGGEKVSIDFFKKFIVVIAVVQIPITLIQYLLAGGGEYKTLDIVTGTFAVYPELISCQLLAIGLLLLNKIRYRKNILAYNSYFLMFILLLPILLSNSRSASGFLLIVLIITWGIAVRGQSINLRVKSLLVVATISLISVFIMYYLFWNNRGFNYQLNLTFVFDYYMRPSLDDYDRYLRGSDPVMGRARAIVESIKLIKESTSNMLLGYGSGAVSDSAFLAMEGEKFQEFGPLAGLGRNQYSKIIVENGLIGLLLFLGFFMSINKSIRKLGARGIEILDVYYVLVTMILIMSFYGMTIGTYIYVVAISMLLPIIQTEKDKIRL